ncbi:hypothetical protein RRV45_15155 [Bacillus sp. DTU_2020_1000418_1_SI_GHA_SEK_038]|uniref:hypothetical protein n=1 Tax=Bacillus sp. DTU_2020_1000418_1_SI_GHA_SEK_038 TaxID=3077585 RepID=UPI0028ED2283|nr:hypothetical protein [Bacillus sp. DTU_2020_1000418_1_SI_GHA_SEK_038]WNS74247.1 hypothetical protein RRV45_15155 [Bacillus sp. DTU_2020_1000418_1_SI_GHA_SEK_038]
MDEIKEKVKELEELKEQHIREVIERLAKERDHYDSQINLQTTGNVSEKKLYLEGVRDGLNIAVGSLSKYVEKE